MSYLLDTHVFYWLLTSHASGRSATVEAALEPEDAGIYVSAVSAFEASTKHRIGKWGEVVELVSRWDDRVATFGARPLDLTPAHGARAGSLGWAHRDPFDRLLAAQAISDGLTFVTADPAFATCPGIKLLRWA